MSERRSSDESKNPPNLVTRPDKRATCPSSMSNRLATIRTTPAQKNFPNPKSKPEPTLMLTPTSVRMFGWMCPYANQRTMASIIRCPARPILAPNILFPYSFSPLQVALISRQSEGTSEKNHRNAEQECQDN